jgi:hypothetical protein
MPPDEIDGSLCVCCQHRKLIKHDGYPTVLPCLAITKPIATILVTADLRVTMPDREPPRLECYRVWIVHESSYLSPRLSLSQRQPELRLRLTARVC